VKKSNLRHNTWFWPAVPAMIFLLTAALSAEPVHVRYPQGMLHGFLVLKTESGETLATGDLVQLPHGDRITTKLVFHFKDGSIDDETTVYSQRGVFRLLSDHHIQKGPAFSHPQDLSIDTSTGQVTVRTINKDGKEDVKTEHVDMPNDLANGMVSTLIMNLPRNTSQAKFSMVVAAPKPRVVKLAISPDGDDALSIQGTRLEAKRYLVKVEIGGLSGVVAPLVGKQPADTHIWFLGGEAPAFLRSLGPTHTDGPLWSTELTSPTWTSESNEQHKKAQGESASSQSSAASQR
jgi:hypothetical protein